MLVKRITNDLWSVDLSFYEIECDILTMRLMICDDARLVSDRVLRRLLLSDKGRQIDIVCAVSPDRMVKMLVFGIAGYECFCS